ncbi:MAG TPA: response regulator [Phycisphaerae bacterium]|nr:response regulator [Phycisphaerae bacterium]
MAGATIVIVDDDRSFVEAVAIFLEDHGYHVLQAFNGHGGLALLQNGTAQLAIIDVHLPDVSGFELARTVRERPRPIPTILISSDDSPETVARCLAAGARTFLGKPLDPQALLDAMAAALDAGS